MAAYLNDGLARRRAEGLGDDVLSQMLRAQGEGQEVSDDEIVASGMILLFGGHETSTNLVANALLALADHPEAAAQLRARPELLTNAVEEFLRYDRPTKGVVRWVRAATSLVRPAPLPGDRVLPPPPPATPPPP